MRDILAEMPPGMTVEDILQMCPVYQGNQDEMYDFERAQSDASEAEYEDTEQLSQSGSWNKDLRNPRQVKAQIHRNKNASFTDSQTSVDLYGTVDDKAFGGKPTVYPNNNVEKSHSTDFMEVWESVNFKEYDTESSSTGIWESVQYKDYHLKLEQQKK